MKKIFCLFLILTFHLMFLAPVFAQDNNEVYAHNNNGEEIVDANSKITLEFEQSFDINDAEIGDEVPFVLPNAIKDGDKVVIPEGSKFIGQVVEKEKSKWAFRRASARIIIKQLVMPDGKIYSVMAEPKNGELKAPAAANVAKGVASGAVAGAACVFGATIIAVECISIVGIIFAPYVGIAVGAGITLTSKGLNYKARKGTKIVFTLDRPIEINFVNYELPATNTADIPLINTGNLPNYIQY